MDTSEILKSLEKILLLTEEQIQDLTKCRNNLIQKFKDVSDEDIESGKLTEQDAIHWIEEFQYDSIAIIKQNKADVKMNEEVTP